MRHDHFNRALTAATNNGVSGRGSGREGVEAGRSTGPTGSGPRSFITTHFNDFNPGISIRVAMMYFYPVLSFAPFRLCGKWVLFAI